MSDDMKTLLPGQQLTLSTKEQVLVRPIGFGKLLFYEEALTKLVSRVLDKGLKLDTLEDYRNLLRVAHEDSIGLMMLILEKPREWFDTIDLADAMEIFIAIVDQNYNDRVKKSIQKGLDKWKSLLQTRSRSLSHQDTHGQTSSDIPSIKSPSSEKAP